MEKVKNQESKHDAKKNAQCELRCNLHGNLSVRGRRFSGKIKKISGQRAVIELERIIYYPKYERYARTKAKLHTHIPKCMLPDIKIGNYVEVGECRPLSKITHFVLLGRIKE